MSSITITIFVELSSKKLSADPFTVGLDIASIIKRIIKILSIRRRILIRLIFFIDSLFNEDINLIAPNSINLNLLLLIKWSIKGTAANGRSHNMGLKIKSIRYQKT